MGRYLDIANAALAEYETAKEAKEAEYLPLHSLNSHISPPADTGELKRGTPVAVLANPANSEQVFSKVSRGVAVNSDLPAKVREKFRRVCTELKIDSEPVLRQFNRWRYPEKDLVEMDGWKKSTVKKHCQLLADEAEMGLDPYNLPRVERPEK